jgi:hypothetical protein
MLCHIEKCSDKSSKHSENYILSHINCFYHDLFLIKLMSYIWDSCKVGVMLGRYEPKISSHGNVYCRSQNPLNRFWSQTYERVNVTSQNMRAVTIGCVLVPPWQCVVGCGEWRSEFRSSFITTSSLFVLSLLPVVLLQQHMALPCGNSG